MLNALIADFRIIFDRDPAARNWLEVLFCYPGLQALILHRLAHGLQQRQLPFVPRLISHIGRLLTGIEIHPGATIGQGVFIDHGMGVVIGETAIVGDYCLIYQGVTLGGTGKESGKRHPTLGDNVVVGAGAKVLGNLNIGENVRIGAGSVVLRDVPADCTVVGVPGRVVYRSGVRVDPLEHGKLPDSEAQAIRALLDRIETLERRIEEMEAERAQVPVAVGAPERPCEDLTLCDWERIAKVAAEVTAAQRQLGQLNLVSGDDPAGKRCRLSDRALEEFFDGAGI
ncbi:MAG: serine O-acetyltransferase [Limnothrix sp.]|uniref:serine O-acetyltransferase n=1 Tax=unclassified Limnothrix TaxID=2632864 RepID=UPI000A868F3B|nr:serine O-acetyltransferase [Limnothrix sp. PR1529]MBD2554789.1 serine O-acetyltransferase [Limnothrix sp. FACHB-708]MBD2591996.1 serine O-acetyltransferase [Limnothrix sp. FACHB-406]MEB3117186.1 serine O-acetyltransferase [Limnothrix sp.]PIB15454.1 serine acetyltransferase [Limnothrix sp. PR1529]